MNMLERTFDNTKNFLKNLTTGIATVKGDKFASAISFACGVGGAVCGLVLAQAFWPLALAAGVAGSCVLAIADWNGDAKSRALSALIGFPIGVVFGPLVGGAMAGAHLGQALGKTVSKAADEAEAQEQTGEATPASESSKGGFNLGSIALRFRRAATATAETQAAPAQQVQQDPPAPKK